MKIYWEPKALKKALQGAKNDFGRVQRRLRSQLENAVDISEWKEVDIEVLKKACQNAQYSHARVLKIINNEGE